MEKNILFEVKTLLGFTVRVSNSYWDTIVSIKHPVMHGKETEVQVALQKPDQIRKSKSDSNVYLFYKKEKEKRWICAIAKKLNSNEGFLITTYPTDSIKEGEEIWKK